MAEKEYIEREALHVAIEKAQIELESNDDKIWSRNKKYYKGLAWARAIITEQPTADVVEVRHGYWVDKPTGRYMHMGSWCSVCGEKSGIGGIESNRHKPYCPNCGAKMDGERKKQK